MNTKPPYTIEEQPSNALNWKSPPDYSVKFFRDGQQIGKFDLNQTPATFEGEVDECAKLFVAEIIRLIDQHKERQP